MEPLYFKDKQAFRSWLEEHHDSETGQDVYIYKKGHEKEGLTYEEAVRTALCYGWIDAVTHKCDEARFIQYFAPRLPGSNWSLSNLIRVRELIEEGSMTENGLTYFDLSWLENLDMRIEQEKKDKEKEVELPVYFKKILDQNHALTLFRDKTNATQRRYVAYIEDAKRQETRLRRCHRIVEMLKDEIKD